MDHLPPETKNAVLKAIASKHKLAAIKLYKDATGCDLKTAKDAIEQHMDGGGEAGPSRIAVELANVESADADLILDAIFERRKLDAVKQYKTSSGRSLLESKQFIEELTAQLEKECPDQFKLASSGAGCASVLLAAIAIATTSLVAFAIQS